MFCAQNATLKLVANANLWSMVKYHVKKMKKNFMETGLEVEIFTNAQNANVKLKKTEDVKTCIALIVITDGVGYVDFHRMNLKHIRNCFTFSAQCLMTCWAISTKTKNG